MKILNNLSALIYLLVLISSVVFGVNFLIKRGATSVFDEITELIFAVFYIFALIFSIFLHLKFRNKILSVKHKLFLGTTFFTFLLFLWFLIESLNCRNEGCLAMLTPLFILFCFWFGSLIIGTIALLSRVKNY